MSFPRMSLHIGDYLKDTRHLRAAEHGAYLLLIMHYWATGGLPDDDKQLAAIACMSEREWRKHRPVIRGLFKDGWKHKRVEAELADAIESRQRRSRAGKNGNSRRWGQHENVDRNATFGSSQCDRNGIAAPAMPMGSLPPASPHGKEPEQGKTSPTDGVEVVDGDGVIRFVPRGRA